MDAKVACKKCNAKDGFSTHGRCVACGNQQYPSKTLDARKKVKEV
jgi:hypothetical protein